MMRSTARVREQTSRYGARRAPVGAVRPSIHSLTCVFILMLAAATGPETEYPPSWQARAHTQERARGPDKSAAQKVKLLAAAARAPKDARGLDLTRSAKDA